MFGHLLNRLSSSSCFGGQIGGVALTMLVGSIALGVPITVAALETSAQLARSSQVYDQRMTGDYSAGAGVEVALWELQNDPTFGDNLTKTDPSTQMTADTNGETVNVTVTRIFGEESLQGQGIIITKSVDPTTAVANATTTVGRVPRGTPS